MSKSSKFGEKVEGFDLPVLNEREIRASAGILFLFAFLSLLIILFKGNFIFAKFFIISFMLDFVIRIFISPKYAPSMIIGRLIVSNQQPEYVGAPQKKFAWIIGLIMSMTMFLLMVVYNTYSAITGIICLICLIFLFFESAFGICLGCIFYKYVYKEKASYCAGNSCETKEKESIQKTSKVQLLVLFIFIFHIFLSIYLLKGQLSDKPVDLWYKLGLKTEAK